MIKNDKWIETQAWLGMISPFAPQLIRESNETKLISYGLSSYGYDIRLSPNDFRTFRHIPGTVIDPKRFNPDNLEPVKLKRDEMGEFFLLPGHSYGLGVAVERLHLPPSTTVLCIGKSTYARCFTGDTKVSLVDGEYSFLELIERVNNGDSLYGWGIDRDNQVVCQRLLAPRYIDESSLIEVVLDNEEVVQCTPDHQFLMRDGSYKEGQDLNPGDSLRAIYFENDHGYQCLWDGVNRKHINPHRSVMGNPDPAKYDVHHINKDKRDNHPRNLQVMTKGEHTALHNRQDKRHIKGGDKVKEMFAAGEWHPYWLHTDEVKAKTKEASQPWKESEENRQNLAKSSQKRWANPDAGQKQSLVAKNGMAALRRRDDVTEESLANALLGAGTIRGAARLLGVDRTAFRRFPSTISQFKEGTLRINHKVKCVRQLNVVKPVFCLTAEQGNFALANGIFVKNCGIIANLTPAEAGWRGHLTLEFSNSSPADAKIYANEGCVQLLFLEGEPCEVSYEDRNGKYQDQSEEVTIARI